jgi:hypothetical protein
VPAKGWKIITFFSRVKAIKGINGNISILGLANAKDQNQMTNAKTCCLSVFVRCFRLWL